jgi:type III secretion protein R
MQINFSDPIVLIVVLIALSLAPFVAIMVTSFVKLVVVLRLLRNALGIQQIPPNMVLNGLATILSIYIMAPVAQKTYERLEKVEHAPRTIREAGAIAKDAIEPLRGFLLRHASVRERRFFHRSASQLWSKEEAAGLTDDSLLVLLPAFTVSELTSAFKIGFLIYLPFIVIDLIVSNILMAMGMMMVSPTTISLPFKLLLFVLIDGWTRLVHGLMLTYQI